jgi:hypothetical protein
MNKYLTFHNSYNRVLTRILWSRWSYGIRVNVAYPSIAAPVFWDGVVESSKRQQNIHPLSLVIITMTLLFCFEWPVSIVFVISLLRRISHGLVLAWDCSCCYWRIAVFDMIFREWNPRVHPSVISLLCNHYLSWIPSFSGYTQLIWTSKVSRSMCSLRPFVCP